MSLNCIKNIKWGLKQLFYINKVILLYIFKLLGKIVFLLRKNQHNNTYVLYNT